VRRKYLRRGPSRRWVKDPDSLSLPSAGVGRNRRLEGGEGCGGGGGEGRTGERDEREGSQSLAVVRSRLSLVQCGICWSYSLTASVDCVLSAHLQPGCDSQVIYDSDKSYCSAIITLPPLHLVCNLISFT
jgi:hypothetical protein